MLEAQEHTTSSILLQKTPATPEDMPKLLNPSFFDDSLGRHCRAATCTYRTAARTVPRAAAAILAPCLLAACRLSVLILDTHSNNLRVTMITLQ